jgi:hypothetical protein
MLVFAVKGHFHRKAVMLVLGLGLKAKIFGLGLASSGLGLDVAGLVNITAERRLSKCHVI